MVKTMSSKFLNLLDRITKAKTQFEVASKEIRANLHKKIENLEKDLAEIAKYHGSIVRLHSYNFI